MILKGLGVEAWITDSKGNQLPENGVKQLDDNKIECWIPSVEGTNFQVMFEASKRARTKFDLRCTPYLDGIRMSSGILLKSSISKGVPGCLEHERVSSSTARPYRFGRRELTDRDDGLQPVKLIQEHLNTIRLEIGWGSSGQKNKQASYATPKDSQPIHERAAKKGHAGSAELGEAIPASFTPEQSYVYTFKPDPSTQSGVFIFRYAPIDWLKAREIIPCSPEPETLEPGSQTGQKRPRDATPEAIDVDDLETDDDDIVIVKHMIPAPDPSKPKRRKSRAEVKHEEEAEESDLEVEESEDVQPKQESDSDEAPTTSKNKRRKVKVEEDVKPKIKK